MPDKRVVDLPTIANLNNSDYMIVGHGNDTYKATVETLKGAVMPTTGRKNISHNGIFHAENDNVYGYDTVTVNVSGGSNIDDITITSNGVYTASGGVDGYDEITVNVPNSYGVLDEGKVVHEGTLVSQRSGSTAQNGTVDTTMINALVVNVPNSYGAGDEGKVVSNGALVAQTSRTFTANGTYNTTNNNSVMVNVSGGGWLDNFVGSFYIGGIIDVSNRMAGKVAGYFYVKDASYNNIIVDWSQPFEIQCTYKHLNTEAVALFGCMGTNYYKAPSVESRPLTGIVWVGIPINGTSWGMSTSITINIPIETWMTVTEVWDGNTVTISVNNGSVTETAILTPSSIYNGGGTSFQFGNVAQDSRLRGENWFLDLERSHIKSNDTLVWGMP